MTTFFIGQRFSSFEEFDKHLNDFMETNKVKFRRRSFKTIESLKDSFKNIVGKDAMNPELIFFSLSYHCFRSGILNSKVKNRILKSYKVGCQAHVKLRVSTCGQNLVVKSFSNQHNHDVKNKEKAFVMLDDVLGDPIILNGERGSALQLDGGWHEITTAPEQAMYKALSQHHRIKDSEEAFGRYVALTLRTYSDLVQKQKAKKKIIEVMLQEKFPQEKAKEKKKK